MVNNCVKFDFVKYNIYEDIDLLVYLIIMLYQEWVVQTFGSSDFTMIDVPKDGACGYSVMALILKDHCPDHQILQRESHDLPRTIQKELAKFVVKNWETKVMDDLGYPTLGEAVLDTHDVTSVDEYDNLFSNHFAGDEDKIKIGEKEVIIKTGKKKGQKVIKPVFEEITVRWAGIPELYAFHKMFDIGLSIVNPERWIERKNKNSGPVKAAIKNPSARFRCSLWFPPSDIGNEATILWDNKVSSPHFLYLKKE